MYQVTKTYRAMIIASILAFGLGIYGIYIGIIKSKGLHQLFYSTAVEGVITKVRLESAGEVTVEVNERLYRFVPYTLDDGIFEHTVEGGDSIFKPAFRDTVVIYKDGRELRYLVKP